MVKPITANGPLSSATSIPAAPFTSAGRAKPARRANASDDASEVELSKEWGETRVTGQTKLTTPPWEWGKR